MTTKFKWTEESAATLSSIKSYEDLVAVAEQLGTSERSVSSKMRNMGLEVPAKPAVAKTFTDEESKLLHDYVVANSGKHTFASLAEVFLGGKFNSKQLQGKLLALELTTHINKAEKADIRTYSADAEVKFVELANSGASIEAISEALSVSVNSARGKALSLLREGKIAGIPVTLNKKDAGKADVLANIDVAASTLAQFVEQTGKTERGVKTMLTRRGIACADYAPKVKKEAAAAE